MTHPSRRGPTLRLLLTTAAWPVAAAAIVAAFLLDYWRAVSTFQSMGAPVTTSFDGSPMPLASAFDAVLWATLPLATVATAASILGLLRSPHTARAPLGLLLLCNLALIAGRPWLIG